VQRKPLLEMQSQMKSSQVPKVGLDKLLAGLGLCGLYVNVLLLLGRWTDHAKLVFVTMTMLILRRYVASGPLVRSSYRAGEFFVEAMIKDDKKTAAVPVAA
jgi:hypothetical protein